ncbi:MAG: hypothetical protein IKZ34_03445 [Alphaproteobacteria bacterium]|nr:hypothetical protein [Alphaproteobacteria bacterium]
MNKENKNFDATTIVYLLFNSMSLGSILGITNTLIKQGYDKDYVIAILMWMFIFARSTQRLYQIYEQKKNQTNQKQK